MKLALMLPNAGDGCSMARGAMPFSMLARMHDDLTLVRGQGTAGKEAWTWDRLAQCDVLFILRPCTEQHLKAIKFATQLGIPVWIDYDDDILNLPMSHPHWKINASEKFVRTVQECCALAQVKTVSTEKLCEVFGTQMVSTFYPEVIPNAHNDYMYGFSEEPRRKIVMWRGSATHREDILSVLDGMAKLAHSDEFKEWKWWFMGDPPPECRVRMPADRFIEGPSWQDGEMDYFEFMRLYQNASPFVNIVPLEYNEFNKSKSNIAWLEGTAAGALTIAPDMREWKRPGIVQYGHPESFEKVLALTMHQYSETIPDRVRESYDFIKSKLLLSDLNDRRWHILCNLTRKPESMVK